jgi:hypothetical protein
MSSESPTPLESVDSRRFSGLHVGIFVVVAILLSVGLTYWVVRTYIYPSEFKPVALSSKERVALDGKLRSVGIESNIARDGLGDEPLTPERYQEDPENREIGLTERELNGLLAHNTDLARRFAIDLSEDLASAKLLIPVDPDFPIFGGRILRVRAGLELAYRLERPVVKLRGISVMGVPLPNAWLGNLKNVDLIEQFGGNDGFWKTFAAGVELIEIREGELKIKLKE